MPPASAKTTARGLAAIVLAACCALSRASSAGPETALREFAGGQVKKGVRTIGMGGDGATTGNYALVYRDAGIALFDEGLVRFTNGNFFTFSGVGFTTPHFWDGSAFYVIAIGQRATGVRVWEDTAPSPLRPPSVGDLADTSVFVKFAKPLGHAWSIGVMGAYELSQAMLQPEDGAPPSSFTPRTCRLAEPACTGTPTSTGRPARASS
jgi:hypothetical protein